MAITAAMVKELREMTGAGMMDCKKALTNTDGDMDAAVEFLRENGLAKAAKKAEPEKETKEGKKAEVKEEVKEAKAEKEEIKEKIQETLIVYPNSPQVYRIKEEFERDKSRFCKSCNC